MLPIGQERAITARELSRRLDTTPRGVTRCIQSLRIKGEPICATVDAHQRMGYYLPETEAELLEYQESLARRMRNMAKTLAAISEASYMDGTGNTDGIQRGKGG